MIRVHPNTGHRPTVREEACRVTVDVADGEFLCMRKVKILAGRRADHTEHWWEAKPGAYGSEVRLRITWSTA